MTIGRYTDYEGYEYCGNCVIEDDPQIENIGTDPDNPLPFPPLCCECSCVLPYTPMSGEAIQKYRDDAERFFGCAIGRVGP